jgi:hypothetical protein
MRSSLGLRVFHTRHIQFLSASNLLACLIFCLVDCESVSDVTSQRSIFTVTEHERHSHFKTIFAVVKYLFMNLSGRENNSLNNKHNSTQVFGWGTLEQNKANNIHNKTDDG